MHRTEHDRGRPFAPYKVAYLLFGVVPAILWAALALLPIGFAMAGVVSDRSGEAFIALAAALALFSFAVAGIAGLWQAASRDPSADWHGRTTLNLTLGAVAAAAPAGVILYVLLFEPPAGSEPGLWLSTSIFGPFLLAGVFLFRQAVFASTSLLRTFATCID